MTIISPLSFLTTHKFVPVGTITEGEQNSGYTLDFTDGTKHPGVVYAYLSVSTGQVVYVGSSKTNAKDRAKSQWGQLSDPKQGGKVYNKRTGRWFQALKDHKGFVVLQRVSEIETFIGMEVSKYLTEEKAFIRMFDPKLNVIK